MKPKRKNPDGGSLDPEWYKEAIFYEARVRSFHDSNEDGIGDFRGFTEKLGYLQDLGVTALWLLPFYPSPLRDDGYDISDYCAVHPDCGTLHDFKIFLREAHRRGIRVVTELVINHTSDQHPWFQRARRAPPGSRWRDFYVWSETPERYKGTRIIFSDFETSNWTWDPIARTYFWHRFYANQPDLNYDNPEVHKEILQALDFWFDLGIDGLRLDAVSYLYEREGTSCEGLPETHDFLRNLRSHVEERYADRMLLAEANQWPEDAVAYFGQGDECHMVFHFPIMPRLFMALHMEDRFPIIDILEQTPEIPANCQWALFLRNHDELTLETVTDEERDYMYRVYAHDAQARINLGIRRRLAPLLGNDRRRIELMNALLLSLPGTPIVYYGDEIGMGDNFFLGDRNGVRTPMQWSPDRNAGFSRANPQRLYLPVIIDPEYNYGTVNVESQSNNPHSLLLWTKRLIALRKRHRAFGRGSIQFLSPNNRRVLAFTRHYEGEDILVVANLSRFVQYVELDLSAYKGRVAVELFGHTEFPPISKHPYLLTLGPHAFYWFSLGPPRVAAAAVRRATEALPALTVRGSSDAVLRGNARASLEALLPGFLTARRWFSGKQSAIRSARIVEQIDLPPPAEGACLTLIDVDYADGSSETYQLPLTFVTDPRALRDGAGRNAIAHLRVRGKGADVEGLYCDGAEDPVVAQALLGLIERKRSMRGSNGEIAGVPTAAYRPLTAQSGADVQPAALESGRNRTSIAFGQQFVLKLFRCIPDGVNTDVELGRFLTEHSFAHSAPVAGHLEYRRNKGPATSLAVLQAWVANEGNAWMYTLDEIDRSLEHAVTRPKPVRLPETSLLEMIHMEPPPLARQLLGAQLESARLLGQRTAELHIALAGAGADHPELAVEEFSAPYRRSLYQTMRNLHGSVFRLAREKLKGLPEFAVETVRRLIGVEKQVLDVFRVLLARDIRAARIRCHGNYSLGQILYTGKDFVIMDFEGELGPSLSERRRKRSPFQDVAAMIRSFDYAAHAALERGEAQHMIGSGRREVAQHWTRFWYWWFSSAFLKAYIRHAEDSVFMPRSPEERDALLTVYLLENSISELGQELGNRPDRVAIPAQAIVDLLQRRR